MHLHAFVLSLTFALQHRLFVGYKVIRFKFWHMLKKTAEKTNTKLLVSGLSSEFSGCILISMELFKLKHLLKISKKMKNF